MLPLVPPIVIGKSWSIDNMIDSLYNGNQHRSLNVIDDYNREGLGIEVGLSLSGARMTRSLVQIIEWRGKTNIMSCDNGSEICSSAFQNWAERRGLEISLFEADTPAQNAYIKRDNSTVRHKWLGLHFADSLPHAKATASMWPRPYDNERHHTRIGDTTPRQKSASAE